MKKSDKIFAVLAALPALFFLLISAFYNRLYTDFGELATAAIWVCLGAEILLVLVYLGRILFSVQDETRFRGGLLLPPATAVLCTLLAFLMLTPVESYQNSRYVSKNLDLLVETAQQLQSEPPQERHVALQGEAARLSVNGEAYIYVCEGDQICVLFPSLDHAQRLEGYLYLPQKILYTELTSRFSSYVFEEIGERLVRVCFYKK